nr:hypothetical protein [uncultured Cupriavidus sp.]
MKRITAPILVLLMAGAAHAEEVKTVTQLLLEKDAQLALQKLDKDIATTAPAPASVNAVPAAQQSRGRSEAPKTIAVYGMDGRAAGLPLTLRSYVKWDDQVYAAKVGGTLKGYKVISITEGGTRLARGKHVIDADRVDDDAVILVGNEQGSARPSPSPTPAGTTPAAAAPGVPTPGAMPIPVPTPGALPLMPVPAAVGAAPIAPTMPTKG